MLKPHFAQCFRWPYVWGTFCCLLGLTPPVLAQPGVFNDPTSGKFVLIPPDADDWTRHFRVGALVGLNISADFKMKGNFNVSGNDPSKGIYDDGYVRTDETGNAGGYTSYWGYDHASQYNAANHTLTMTASSGFSAAGNASGEDGAIPGFELVYGANHWYWKHARVGWELGLGVLPINISASRSMSGKIDQSTYTFDTGNIVVPEAPYQGGASGQGPLISDAYPTPGHSTTDGNVTGSYSLDVNLYTIRLGPAFNWDVTEKFGVTLGAGPAIGVVSGNYNFNELITTGGGSVRNHGKTDATDVVFGGYVNATVLYHIQDGNRNADIYVGVQYMPMSDATIGSDGREGRLNLGGQIYLSAGLNWPF